MSAPQARKSGSIDVTKHGRYRARVSLPNGERPTLGVFETRELAELALSEANALLAEERSAQAARVAQRVKGGTVYFIEAVGAGRVKIGWTAGDVKDRLSSLRTGSAFELRPIATYPASDASEAEMHVRFRAHRIGPRTEWFRIEGALAVFLGRSVAS